MKSLFSFNQQLFHVGLETSSLGFPNKLFWSNTIIIFAWSKSGRFRFLPKKYYLPSGINEKVIVVGFFGMRQLIPSKLTAKSTPHLKFTTDKVNNKLNKISSSISHLTQKEKLGDHIITKISTKVKDASLLQSQKKLNIKSISLNQIIEKYGT